METTYMTERITLCSVATGIDPVTHRPLKQRLVEEFTVWAEVARLPIREMIANGSKIGFVKESPVFKIAYQTPKEIQPNWLIKWRGKQYAITGMDPDYRTKDTMTILTQEVTANERNSDRRQGNAGLPG